MDKGYKFVVAGQFAGVTSFTDEDDQLVNFLKIDYFGGRVQVPISSDVAEKYEEKKKGCDVRAVGNVFVAGGSFRLELVGLRFEDDKDFESVSFEESTQGMIMKGPAKLDKKVSFTRRADGIQVFQGDFWLYGGKFTLDVSSECYASMEPGVCLVEAQLFSEVASSMSGGKRQLKVSNWISVISARPLKAARR